MQAVRMCRCRKRLCRNVNWKLGLGTSSAILTYVIVFTIVCTNVIVVLVFSATRTQHLQTSISVLPRSDVRQQDHGPSSLNSLSDLLTNGSWDGLEDTISVKVKDLLRFLKQFKDHDGDIRQSSMFSVLQEYKLTIEKERLSCCQTIQTSTNLSSQLLESHRSKFSSDPIRSDDGTIDSSRVLHTSPTRRKDSHSNVHNIQALEDPSIKRGLSQEEQHKNTVSSSSEKHDINGLQSPLGPTIDVHGEKATIFTANGLLASVSRTISCVNYTKSLTNLAGKITPVMQEKSPHDLAVMFPLLQKGGHFTPKKCLSKENTAIIIPYRNRYSHLHILLLNILPLLIKQNVEFTIFVVEQELPGTFNRGMLFNVGFLEALKLDAFDCFIFHDVDLIPINEYNFYYCNDQPTHFVSGVNKFKYKLMYSNMFGGVVAFTQQQFKDINGASNLYFGWGGEDDDLGRRVVHKGYNITRTFHNIGLYDMITHKRDASNKANPLRGQMLKLAKNTEGLNTTIYTRHSVELLPLYTWVKVTIKMTDVFKTAPKEMNKLREKLLKHFSHEQ